MTGNPISKQIAALIYPAQCPFCKSQRATTSLTDRADSKCQQQEDWCDECYQKLVGNPLDRCLKCGASTGPLNPFPVGCRLCHGIDLRFSCCVAIGNYRDSLQELVIEMKRCHNEILAIQLGRLLGYRVQQLEMIAELDFAIPIPTHWWRKFQRGFHAASVITDGIHQVCGIRKSNQILVCKRNTKKQGTLSNAARFKNVRGAFEVRPRANVKGKKVLLVDDVMTSGATTSEAGKTLLKAGAASVFVAVAARGARVS